MHDQNIINKTMDPDDLASDKASVIIEELNSLINLLNKHKQEDTVRVNLLLDIAFTYWYAKERSLPFVEEALALSEKLSYTKGVVYSKYRYIQYLWVKYKNDTAKIIANEILDLSKTKNYKKGTCLAYFSLMEYNYFSYFNSLSGNDESALESAVEFFEKIKSECIGLTDKYILIKAGYLASASYIILGNKNKGEECLNSVKPYFSELRNKSMIMSFLNFKSIKFL